MSYKHAKYADSLREFGTPYYLSLSQGWILKRQIRQSDFYDAVGCYPLFSCHNWTQLHYDLEKLDEQLVSVTLVTDPFGQYDENYLRHTFKDRVVPFKKHYIVDLKRPLEQSVSSHHRYYARRSMKDAVVQRVTNPPALIDAWWQLYRVLIDRHQIKGIQSFSYSSFLKQLAVPGTVAFVSKQADELTGMQIWYVDDCQAYHHLSAYSAQGYNKRVSYALLWTALTFFQEASITWADLGGGAGLKIQKDDGLTKFKKGWATDFKMSYLCGRVLNSAWYTHLAQQAKAEQTSYFPAYRSGEFS